MAEWIKQVVFGMAGNAAYDAVVVSLLAFGKIGAVQMLLLLAFGVLVATVVVAAIVIVAIVNKPKRLKKTWTYSEEVS